VTTWDAGVAEMNIGRHVAIATLLVVASFSATLAVSQWRLQPIEALALDIARDAAPSIEHLSTGLATVKKIVEAYKVRVGVASTQGCGSTFWFAIPKAPRNTLPVRPDSTVQCDRELPEATA
jgi:hypothetical protein